MIYKKYYKLVPINTRQSEYDLFFYNGKKIGILFRDYAEWLIKLEDGYMDSLCINICKEVLDKLNKRDYMDYIKLDIHNIVEDFTTTSEEGDKLTKEIERLLYKACDSQIQHIIELFEKEGDEDIANYLITNTKNIIDLI